jgi:hypothetical protein
MEGKGEPEGKVADGSFSTTEPGNEEFSGVRQLLMVISGAALGL